MRSKWIQGKNHWIDFGSGRWAMFKKADHFYGGRIICVLNPKKTNLS